MRSVVTNFFLIVGWLVLGECGANCTCLATTRWGGGGRVREQGGRRGRGRRGGLRRREGFRVVEVDRSKVLL